MPRIEWDKTGERYFETGVDQAVLYPVADGAYPKGYPWNGVTSITAKPSGADATPLHADNIKYLNLVAAEDFGATIEAYTYPDEFAECDGSAELAPGITIGQQARKVFGLSYRTKLGNDTDGQDHGYKIHLVWGALAAPSESNYQSVNDSPEATTFSWELSTTPVNVVGHKPCAHMTINSTKLSAEKLKILEDALYGTSDAEAHLPTPDEIVALITAA